MLEQFVEQFVEKKCFITALAFMTSLLSLQKTD